MAPQIEQQIAGKRALSRRLSGFWEQRRPRAPRPTVPPNDRRNRRGVTLVLALLCLAVSTMLVANLVRIIRLENQKRVSYENTLQADWLARYALERAAQQLAADATYDGETWDIVLAANPLNQSALTGKIGRATITRQHDQPATVTVVVRYPVDQRHEITKTLTKQFSWLKSIPE